MAQIHYGTKEQFNALAFGEPHPSTVSMIDQMYQQFDPSTALTEQSQAFMQKAYDLYQDMMGSGAIRTAKAAVRNLSHGWMSDEVQELRTTAALQQAPSVMRRYLMVEPTTRQWYYQQRLEGYVDHYTDPYPETPTEDHYDYHRVMDGIVTEQEDGSISFTEYLEEPLEGDRPLVAEEQFDIINTWNRLASQLFSGNDDPTSPYNAEL